MDFILKPELLPLYQPKPSNLQYYHWAEKKRVEKEKQQFDHFNKMWVDIQTQDKNHKDHKDHKDQKIKIQKKVQKKVQKKSCQPEQFYIKNLIWKNNVDEKVNKIRQEMKFDEERKQNLHMKTNQLKKQQKNIFRDEQHKGPISAWNQRFDSYLKSKYLPKEQEDFVPCINKNSRRITSRMVGKVEDRLIQYGQKLKIKKNEMEQADLEKNQRKRQESNLVESNMSDVFWRLYKQGEKYNKNKNEMSPDYPFTPQINHYSQEMEQKITNRRKPLYESKINQNNAPNKNQEPKTVKQNQKSFQDFMKRNQMMIQKIEKNRIKKAQQEKQKSEKEVNKCTFAPCLNQKSMKIFENKKKQILRFEIQRRQFLQSNSQPSNDQKTLKMQSQNGASVSYLKYIQHTDRFQRLNSMGNLPFPDSSRIYINDQDSISNAQHNLQKQDTYEELFEKKEKYNSYQQQMIFTERNGNDKTQIYNIDEEIEEDSIQRGRQSQWQNQLQRVQEQIQMMMSRATTYT